MKKIVLILCLVTAVWGQDLLKKNSDEYRRNALSSNGVVDILLSGNRTWIATGGGLESTGDYGKTFSHFDNNDFGGKGGVASLLKTEDDAVWISIADDSTIDGTNYIVGEGFAYTADNGNTWNYIPQPVDPNVPVNESGYSDSLGYYPTTTRVQNVTYDLAQSAHYIWSAAYGGGLRRAVWPRQNAGDYDFKVITTDGHPFDSYGELAHRVFSLYASGSMVIVGSAAGVAITDDEGETWNNSSFAESDPLSLPANFIVSLNYWADDNSIWAGCVETGIYGEKRGVAVSRNSGLSWKLLLEGRWIYSINFIQGAVFCATDEGMYISYDRGETWIKNGVITDYQTGEFFTSEKMYSSAGDDSGEYLWFGSQDGLALRSGNLWKIFRSYRPAGINGEKQVYAYPNPYSPERKDFVRFQFRAVKGGRVKVSIYTYAMEKIVEITEDIIGDPAFPDRSIKWNGRDPNGRIVENGVYFFRLQSPAGVFWDKIVIVN